MRVRAGVALGLAALVAGLPAAAWAAGGVDVTRVVPPPAPMAGSLVEIAQAYAAGLPTIGAIRLDGDLLRVDLRPGEPAGFSFARGSWEGELLLLAVHRQLASNAAVPGLTSAWAGLLFSTPGQDGPTGGSSGATSTPPTFELRVSTRSRDELGAAVIAGARELGLVRPAVEWLRVGDLDALVVTATARSPRRFLERWSLGAAQTLFGGAVPELLGLYVELRDRTGAPFIGESSTPFSGGSWYREDVADLRNGGPAPISSQLLRRVEVTDGDRRLSIARTVRRQPEARAFAAAEGALGLRVLPPPVAQTFSCARPLRVTLTYEDGHTVRYGPCRLPAPVRLAGKALLRVHALGSCAAPSRPRGGAVRLGPYRIAGLDPGHIASARTTRAGRLVLPVVPLVEPSRPLQLLAWPCQGDPGGYATLRPWIATTADARRRPLPAGADPATTWALVARVRRTGLYRLYLADPEGRFLGTAVLRFVRP
ncbi:MAG: hypothetical protein R3C15_05165 [Thermoleophilia bacterium]